MFKPWRIRVDIRAGSGAGTGAACAIKNEGCFADIGLQIKINGW